MNTNDREATENKTAHVTAAPLIIRSNPLTLVEKFPYKLRSKRVFQIPVASADRYT